MGSLSLRGLQRFVEWNCCNGIARQKGSIHVLELVTSGTCQGYRQFAAHPVTGGASANLPFKGELMTLCTYLAEKWQRSSLSPHALVGDTAQLGISWTDFECPYSNNLAIISSTSNRTSVHGSGWGKPCYTNGYRRQV
jgi:hypothetical protein